MERKKPKAIDLFAGIGGIRIGFEAAGFEIAYSNDFDKKAVETYRSNFNGIDESNLFDVIKERRMKRMPKRFDILLGGFPCQPFSISGTQAGLRRQGQRRSSIFSYWNFESTEAEGGFFGECEASEKSRR